MPSTSMQAHVRRLVAGARSDVAGRIDRATPGDGLRVVALLAIVVLLAVVGVNAATYAPANDTSLQRGTIESPANGTTIVSVQGYTFGGKTNPKKPARLIAAGERGETDWTYESRRGSDAWFFDVDPLENGNLLVVSPRNGETLVYEFDPDSRERVWIERFDYTDTHDIDMLENGDLAIAHMRAWDAEKEVSNDEVVVYNRSTDEITWRWRFRDHYPNGTDGGFNDDWTHVNDVDRVGEDRFLLSPRNFDQAIIVNQTTGEIDTRLGIARDVGIDEHDETTSAIETHSGPILTEQHNPDYLVGPDGTPTLLVADSGNDRVVEYAYLNGTWQLTWEVGTDSLQWPRDADRLPNGNTLIVDTLNHRVIEVTPTGEIVWEYYATWGPYDAERLGTGDESNGPTIRAQNATGRYELTGSAGLRPGTGDNLDFPGRVRATFAGTPVSGPATSLARLWGHYMPWFRPVWLTSWDAAFLVTAGLIGLAWGSGEALLRRKRLVAGIRRRLPF